MAGMRWLPLESNPEVINKYVASLGISTNQWSFTDIYGLDPDLLMMVPRPVAAVMLLYPIGKKSESQPIGNVVPVGDLYFLKQTIGNACGTIGLLHALINNRELLSIPTSAHLGKFYEATKGKTPAERAAYMETDKTLGSAHEESANEGQTKAPSREDKTNFHFICFVHKKGILYELDGRKDGPVKHGTTTAETLLEDACQIVKKFMQRDPDNLNFTMIALSKA